MLIQWLSNLLAFLFGISNGHHPASNTSLFRNAGLDWKAIARVAASIDDLTSFLQRNPMACNRTYRQKDGFNMFQIAKLNHKFMTWNHLKPRFPFSLAPQFGFSNPFSSIPSFDVCPAETKARWRLVPAARICPWAFPPVQLLVGRASAGKVLEKLWRKYIIKRIAKIMGNRKFLD